MLASLSVLQFPPFSVSVAGCLGYDVLAIRDFHKLIFVTFQLLVV